MPPVSKSKSIEGKLRPELWLELHGDYLFSFCMLRVSDRATAEDLVQDTLVSALRARESFLGQSSERTWLSAILRNKIVDHYRKKSILSESTSLSDSPNDPSSEFFRSEDGHWRKETAPRQWSEGPDAEIEGKEFTKVLQACISKMPASLAPVFVARFIDEEDSEEICKVHGISSSNYWVILHRAKLLIRSCLEKNWFSHPHMKQ